VAATGKPVLLSTGAATVAEIERAIGWLDGGPERLVLLVCTLTYPTPDADAHFARLGSFRDVFAPYPIGVSDHTLGVAGAWMTAALGGVCIEKHYTIDRRLPDVPDHAMSVEPDELAEMVRACDRAAVLLGEDRVGVRPSEEPARANARRSIVLERDVARGERLGAADLGFKRPGTGIPPFEAERVVGARVRRDLARGTILTDEALERP
jgi:sialic acid synthase SpsE